MTAPIIVVLGEKECLRDVKRIKGSQMTTMVTMMKVTMMMKHGNDNGGEV